MGQAFITRRGGGNGRFATGVYFPPPGAINGTSYDSIMVDGLPFSPKQIMIFTREYDGTLAYRVDSLVWTESGGIVLERVDFDQYQQYDIKVVATSDGFNAIIVHDQGIMYFQNSYYWVAFEKEQEV